MANVYPFDHPHETAPRQLQHLLGDKGAHLADLATGVGLSVPPGFTISTGAGALLASEADGCEDVIEEVRGALLDLERTTGRQLGSDTSPLLVAIRSGTARSMPGLLRSVLNIGLNERTVAALAAETGDEHLAVDSYRRLIERYGQVVLGIDAERFGHRRESACLLAGVDTPDQLPVDRLRDLVEAELALVESETGAPFPDDPVAQIRGAIVAAVGSWDSPSAQNYRHRERVPPELALAVSVQQMVFGNLDDRSGTGVAFSRHPTTGVKELAGEFLPHGQEIADGGGLPIGELATRLPDVQEQLDDALARLEVAHRDMVAVEFTVERGRLWLLDAGPADRSGAAAVRAAVAMHQADDLGLSRAEAVLTVTGDHLDQLLHPQVSGASADVIATGLGASPGAAVGRAYFDPDRAVDAYDEGHDVILVMTETSPEDVHGMSIAEGILTSKGGLASHAAVVARGWGTPAVCGASDIEIGDDRFVVGDVVVVEGDEISIDGGSGEVFRGAVDRSDAEIPPEMDVVLGWADEIRAGHMGVRANADTAEDAARAREFGAEGIGLCRTEHQFLGERLPIVRKMILATSADEEQAALELLGAVQRADFVALFEAMDGLPVTVRLLDPPLHEFLPDIDELLVAEAKGDLDTEGRELLAAAQSQREENPMLGTRGVRLGILREGLFRMQAHALADAIAQRVAAGGTPLVEVMVPLVVNRAELDLVRRWLVDEMAAVLGDDLAATVAIGTMIETPRAAVCAGAIAGAADFFSFGTNDLTQMTFGFSRDDIESRIMKEYIDRELLGANPFETIDRPGVGALVMRAAADARQAAPELKLGVCGEHGGDPDSIGLFVEAGLDYVSCSPFRVPIARLAAARALAGATVGGAR